ncbi:MAG TPA: YbbR-like domain-containing protein, partial [Salinimicrobium sp.]|nr:YbbR-like domain-containing protein [Salinimicrobium sp.]
MINKLKALTKTRFKRTNFNAFLFFLSMAVIIWIFSQFSKQYNEIIQIPVEYVNVPPDKLITEDNPNFLKLKMENTGFIISYYSLLPPTLKIDISKARQADGRFLYSIPEHRDEIQSQLGINFDNSEFVREVASINFQQRKEKMIPVFPQIEVDFAVGHAASGELTIEPDSITVSGPDNILDTLNQLHTVPLQVNGVQDDIFGKIAIDTSYLSSITIYQNQVDYSLEVEKFTEGSVEIPVEVMNVPQGLNVVIFPKEVLLFYQVSLQDYKEVTASDFRVIC